MILDWPCPRPADPAAREYAFGFDRGRTHRLLIVPALFEEANRTRRMLVEMMRELDRAGIDAVLPDLPGCNESLADFSAQSLDTWRTAMARATAHFGATHVLAVRGGALVAPDSRGWALEPARGASLLRQLVRARTIAAREAGREERAEDLLARGRTAGLELAGYRCGATLIAGLEAALPAPHLAPIALSDIGGPALWLRSEPGENPAQSAALAARILAELSA